ncbi:unnamed protein product [Adineta steineri]|uniref:Uncharacterized protein n=2 Tax=Adineta steineri TaxID=433720 RepID=A0A814CAJ0_9BILA|nr:unnamed protein product [Adineta steineri]CAF1362581.1 unnamed protein product [Adineta steineri]CAF1367617.1 unnamed protein product [Adineta steineri]
MAATMYGYDTMRSGDVVLFYVNRDGLPLSDRCNERMWNFCIEQNPKHASEIQTIRDRTINYAPKTYPDPPYHIATNPRLKVHEKLQLIQNYIQRLEYNYTGMQFFDINPARSIYGLMDIAKQMMTESLPIKCFESFLIAVYLTTGIIGLDRFNISFKTSFNSIIYRHVVLGVKYQQYYGALGLSRRDDLSYKSLDGKYERLSTLIDDFVCAYKRYGHTVLRIRIGLPIIHDLKSFLNINWNVLKILPNKTDKIDYDRELDKIVRLWRQTDMNLTYRSVASLTSLITAATLPNRGQSIQFRLNRETSLTCRRSAIKKTSTATDGDHSIEKDESVPFAIRV